ncbi:hypothetical protein BpHYR1_025394 [Brachionus plicatilis]|uniref:Uncharacterized protein n=1 Tax=Brachionus plicatilis TaxID=10195 RepID=A0A3M7RGR5_BRAPC|nr:hypothetical protein BpHYR1_025394 [Brachionus plicatilis]
MGRLLMLNKDYKKFQFEQHYYYGYVWIPFYLNEQSVAPETTKKKALRQFFKISAFIPEIWSRKSYNCWRKDRQI